MFQVGLTGGIGSGKSTVATLLSERGARLVDADAISRQLTQPGGQAVPLIAQQLGSELLAPDGTLDRAALRTRVFADASTRLALEGILHPLIAHRIDELTAAAWQDGTKWVVLEIPLLLESKRWQARLDHVLVVDCLPATQVQRTCARSGLSRETVEQIIAAQVARPQRLRGADSVIFNEGLTLDGLRAQIALWTTQFGL
jgi:dephospho-CoA kinase